jgi:hypothetical protein
MPITISKIGDRYVAEVTPPHGGGIPWATDEPTSAQELVRALTDRGCHQTDIGDAFYAADDVWLHKIEASRSKDNNAELRLGQARAAVESTGLPERVWAVGEFRDDRPCLVLDDHEWVAGSVERGRFAEEFRETDTGTAVARFVMWARAILESSEASAAATAEWLRRTGQERP